MELINFRTYFKFLRNNKLYTIVAILGFSVSLMFVLLLSIYVKQELSVDSFHKNKDRIYLLAETDEIASFSNPVAELIKDNIPEVENFTRIHSKSISIETNSGKIYEKALFADSSFFNIFSFKLLEGETSKVLETKNAVVITPALARKLFKDENPIGKNIKLDKDNELIVTGLMERFPQNTQIPYSEMVVNYQMMNNYFPNSIRQGKTILTDWGTSSFVMYFLAKENTDLQLPSKSQSILDLFYKMDYFIYSQGLVNTVMFKPLEEIYFSNIKSSDIRTNSKKGITIYLGITILILIVAILNYINLSVSQASKRGKEVALKKFLGCSKKDLILQLISESILMTSISFAIAIFLAFLFEPFFNDVLNTKLNMAYQLNNIGYILSLVFSIILIGFISGIIPAITVSRFKSIEVFKGEYMMKVRSVYSKVFITFQYVVAIGLLVCSLFIIKQTLFMKNYDLGYEKDNILVMENVVNHERISGLQSRLENITGVDKVSFSIGSPLNPNNETIELEDKSVEVMSFYIDSAFFNVFNIEITTLFETPLFNRDNAWLNQKTYNAVVSSQASNTIVYKSGYSYPVSGIINDFHAGPLNFANKYDLILMRPLQNGLTPNNISVKINSAVDPIKTAKEIKEVYSEFTGGEPVDPRFADDSIQEWYKTEEKMSKILMAFTILTFVILLMGIFAMSMYYVRQKEKEIGIRRVNGATEKDIIVMLNLNFVKWIVLAFTIAIPIAYYAMTRWLENYSFKTSLSWWLFLLTGILVLFITIAFISMQSWKTATANPVDSLKSE